MSLYRDSVDAKIVFEPTESFVTRGEIYGVCKKCVHDKMIPYSFVEGIFPATQMEKLHLGIEVDTKECRRTDMPKDIHIQK